MARLTDKVAIITGGAGGIGLAAAKRFLDEGARMMLVGRTAAKLEAAQAALDGGDRVAIATADVSDEAATQAFVRETKDRFGRLDILFGNAGTEGTVKPLTDLTVDEFDSVMTINVRGAWLSMKHAAPLIADSGGGSIILTSSVAGAVGVPGISAYTASKHAIAGLARSAAQELAGANIRVNTILPAPVDNDMMRAIERQAAPDNPEAARAGFLASIPLGRYGSNEEVAALALFLASDDAAFCTGGLYPVDGGFTAR